jgi:glycine cleavage system aminomethyltransferase T/glycine/D-amino acid oxidase-like deaminating enzyme
MTASFPTQARIVVIGGGVIGTSIAFHLARMGEKDVVLLEKASLTEGCTWHAAGLVGQFRSQQNLMSLMNDSVRLYDTLLEETGQDPGWRKVGSLRLATTQERWKELLKSHSAAQAVGFEMNMLDAKQAHDVFPLMEIDDVVGAAFIPDDGYIDPNSLTQALAKGFRANGGRIFERTMVTDLVRDKDRLTHVITDHGSIEVDIVINAAGLWARQVGWMAGAEIPAGIVEHQYLVTEKSDLIPDNLPALRDPDGSYYVKPEPGALAIGGWESRTRAVDAEHGFAWENERFLFDSNLERLEEFFAPALKRLPVLNSLGIRTIINGPIPISPDGEPVMGPVPGFNNFYAACAFTSGIAASGGAGKAMANWIVHGDPGFDLWSFDIRRFGALQAGTKFLHERAVEAYARYYHIHWPGEEMETARGIRRSPLYQTLKQQGAVFGSKFGWERANWFAQGDIPQVDVLGFERPQQDITVGREHRAARERAVLIDMSSFTKFEISGQGACDFLQYLCVANVDKQPGCATYTQLCNERGGIEADVTIIRRSENCFWLITGSGFGVRDRHWIENKREQQVDIRDITSAYGVINLAGPLARKVLEKVCDEDINHEAFGFMTTQDIRIGYAPALAFRVTYIGELGWELYIPSEYMQYVYEVLQQAGAEFDITNIGYRAIDSLRMEKKYLAWGVDITPDYNPHEAGLQFLIDWNKGDFLGRDALVEITQQGVSQKLVCLALDDPLAVFGGEAIFVDGQVVAQSTSGNFGYTIGKSLVLAYLPIAHMDAKDFTVEAFGNRSSASIIKGCAYDPGRQRILC